MGKPQDKSIKYDILAHVVRYHENVKSLVDEINRYFKDIEALSKDALTAKCVTYYDETKMHFKFEDAVVFPAIRASGLRPSIKAVMAKFSIEHTKIMDSMKNIINNPENSVQVIITELKHICFQLIAHAKEEEDLLFPEIEKNNTIRFLIGKSFVAQRDSFRGFIMK